MASYIEAGLNPWVRCTAEQETSLLASADALIAIQHLEADLLKRMLPDHAVGVAPHYLIQPIGYRKSSGFRLLFVGDDHSGNLGILRFIDEVLPIVLSHCPQATLRVCGGIVKRLKPAPGLTIVGVVDDLEREYQEAAIVVCPIEKGTGLKIKVVEALSVGRAIVGSRSAFLGLVDPKESAWCEANDPHEQAQAIVDLLRDDVARWKVEEAGRRYALELFSEQSACSALKAIIEKGRSHRDARRGGFLRRILRRLLPRVKTRHG